MPNSAPSDQETEFGGYGSLLQIVASLKSTGKFHDPDCQTITRFPRKMCTQTNLNATPHPNFPPPQLRNNAAHRSPVRNYVFQERHLTVVVKHVREYFGSIFSKIRISTRAIALDKVNMSKNAVNSNRMSWISAHPKYWYFVARIIRRLWFQQFLARGRITVLRHPTQGVSIN